MDLLPVYYFAPHGEPFVQFLRRLSPAIISRVIATSEHTDEKTLSKVSRGHAHGSHGGW